MTTLMMIKLRIAQTQHTTEIQFKEPVEIKYTRRINTRTAKYTREQNVAGSKRRPKKKNAENRITKFAQKKTPPRLYTIFDKTEQKNI